MKFYRKDKRVRCMKCYYDFWIDALLPKKYNWCPRCNSMDIEYVKEYGKIIKEVREYDT